MNIRSNLQQCAGLLVPPFLWAVNTQMGLILSAFEGPRNVVIAAALSVAAAILSLTAGLVSWRVVVSRGLPETGHPNSASFVGGLGGLSGLVFAFALALQAASTVVVA
jgi:hypothetical protein